MRVVAVVLVCLALAASRPAIADEACGAGASSRVIVLSGWTIKANPLKEDSITFSQDESDHMTETMSYSGSKGVRLVDGDIRFADALGGDIGSMAIDRDAHIKAGGTYNQKGDWDSRTFARLLKMDKADVVATACVRAVVYDDGTKQSFE